MVNGVVEIPLPAGNLDRGSRSAKEWNPTTGVGTFVAGPENRLARVAVQSVLNDVDDGYSPMVFYGPPGTGKSHLAWGLALAWKACFRKRAMVYVTAVDFVRQLADAIQTKTVEAFSGRYRQASLLVLEDIHHLGGKAAAQRELTSTLDALDNAGSRVILTASKLPSALPGIVPRLESRLAAGLAVRLAPPGAEARLVVLRRLAATLGLELSETAAQLLADQFQATVPELSAAVSELRLLSATGGLIDVETVRQYLTERDGSKRASLHQIALATAGHFSLRLADLRSPTRRRAVAAARGVAMFLARNLTTESLDQIGRYFGGRDRTTVSYGCRKTEERLETEPEIRQAVVALEESLKGK